MACKIMGLQNHGLQDHGCLKAKVLPIAFSLKIEALAKGDDPRVPGSGAGIVRLITYGRAWFANLELAPKERAGW